jgi:FRG domain
LQPGNRPPENPPAASAVWGIATVRDRQIVIKEPRHLSIKVTDIGSREICKSRDFCTSRLRGWVLLWLLCSSLSAKHLHVVRDITSVAKLLEAVAHSKVAEKEHRHVRAWFRGQGDENWQLQPGVYRDNFAKNDAARIRKERHLTQDFVALSTPLRDNLSDAEIYFLQQHYRMPTRLLDWSLNPLAAAFFALEPCDKNGILFILDAYNFKPLDRGLCTPLSTEVVSAMEAIFQWKDDKWPKEILPVRPSYLDKRISAQHGCFTFHPPGTPVLTCDNNKTLRGYTIPAAAKNSLRKELELLGIDEFTIYGDLDHLAERLKRAYRDS